MNRIAVLLTLVFSSVNAQVEVSAFVGYNSPDPTFWAFDKSALYYYWAEGITGGTNVYFPMTNHFWISSGFEYTHYKYDKWSPFAMVPEQRIQSTKGENSHVYRFLLETRYYVQTKLPFQLFAETGLAYTIEKIGKIQAVVEDMNGPTTVWNIHYLGRSYFTHNLGAGIRVDVIHPIALDISAIYFTDYSIRLYTAYHLGLIFSLGT